MNFPTRWQSAILDALSLNGRATIIELAEALNVSDETIRRHIKPLVDQGTLERIHGSVILADAMIEPPFSRRMKERTEAKRAIAAAVAERVSDRMTLFIDSGSTTAYVARALLQKRDLTIITNALDIARTLVGRCNHVVHLAGGLVKADMGAAVGREAHQLIADFQADLAILSIGSITAEEGCMDYDVEEARLARAMIERADKAIVAADASKYNAKARARICDIDQVSVFVSDLKPPSALARKFKAAGTDVVVAGTPR
jgi:DeoR family transcriptional regulator, glycerol-3-phosphate regulon repressor